MRTLAVVVAVSVASVVAHPVHDEPVRRGGLVGGWSHPPEHPVHGLFRRDPATGSYPDGIPDANAMPQAWKDALAAVTAAGLIPNITQTKDGVYPAGVKPTDPAICASAFECRADGDIWDAPDGMLGVSFDDGPTPNSPKLYDFLKSQNQRATHFFIGNNIKNLQSTFMQAFNQGDDIAVHTYTHRWMTSLSNADIVAELGWTMQIIYDLTGGRVARYWRPPFGDSDNRVRSIAKNVFGLIQVDWNQDTADWELGNGKTTPQAIATALQQFINGPKSPGLIILEHELYPGTVQAFIDAYPSMKAKGWDTRSIPDLFPDNAYYQNAQDDTAPVQPMNIVKGASAGAAAGAVSLPPASSTSASTTTTVPPAKANAAATTTSTAPATTSVKPNIASMTSPSQLLAALASSFVAFWIFL